MFTSKHHPDGGATSHFDNERITELTGRYQTLGDPEALSEVIVSTRKRALALIRFNRTARYQSEHELLSDVNFKFLRVVGRFDASKGSAFTFLSQVITTTLCTSVTTARKNAHRYTELDANLIGSLPAKSADHSVSDDLTHKIKAGVKTTLTDAYELGAQRWYIESFTDERFESRRHACANAAMKVFGLSHSRSRELYDLSHAGGAQDLVPGPAKTRTGRPW